MNREPRVGRPTAVAVTAALLAAALGAALAPGMASNGSSPDVATQVNLNTAPARELELLPGVGRALAERIVQNRAQDGPFRSVHDLDRVRGVGPALMERLAPHVAP